MKVYFPFKGGTNLGNWMWQYAAAISTGHEVVGWLKDPGAERKLKQYGDIFGDIPMVKELPEGVSMYNFPKDESPHILRFDGTEDVCIMDYYGKEDFYDEDIVRAKFRITQNREQYLRGRYGKWLDRTDVTGISVRRGDYMNMGYCHPFVGEKYLKDCIARIPECKTFIICSDDIPWCRKFFSKHKFPGKEFCFVEGESVLDQLYVHTLCKNNIISNSSFSWWGAWLNANPNKRVLAPSLWLGFFYDYAKVAYFRNVEVVENHQTVRRWLYAHLIYRWVVFKRWAYPAWKLLQDCWVCTDVNR